jgi:hypothetical protein
VQELSLGDTSVSHTRTAAQEASRLNLLMKTLSIINEIEFGARCLPEKPMNVEI